MNKDRLLKILEEYVHFDINELKCESYDRNNVSFSRIVEILSTYGIVEVKNNEEQYIILTINHGSSAFSQATVLVSADNDRIDIISYAKEGIIKQNIAQKNIDNIKKLIDGKKIKKGITVNLMIISIVFICLALCLIGFLTSKPKKIPHIPVNENIESEEKTSVPTNLIEENDNEEYINDLFNQYNTAVQNYNNIAEAYNKEIHEISIINISNLPSEMDFLDKIEMDNKMSGDDIVLLINEIIDKIDASLYSYNIVHNLYILDENNIIDLLKNVKNVVDIEKVTENNDPNQLLGKDGGYISCVYFSLDLIDASNVPGNTTIEKGTDAGGCIELYKTAEEANNRCDYLSQFDDTLLYSGSYAIVGRAVIRTSYLLTNQQQINVTEQIVNEIISSNYENNFLINEEIESNLFAIVLKYKNKNIEVTTYEIVKEYETEYGTIENTDLFDINNLLFSNAYKYNIKLDNSRFDGKIAGLPYNMPYYVRSME